MKEAFKLFVQKNPQLVNYVTSNKMTWQQFYEIYDLYGENNSIWNNFKDTNKEMNTSLITVVKELFNQIKGIDLNSVQKTLTSLDKAIEAFKGFNTNNDVNTTDFGERPKYKYFED